MSIAASAPRLKRSLGFTKPRPIKILLRRRHPPLSKAENKKRSHAKWRVNGTVSTAHFLSARPRDALHEGRGSHDRYIAKRIKREQIAVAAYDQIRMAVHRQLEKFVVGRITARGDELGDRHHLGGGQHLQQPYAQQGYRCRGYLQVVDSLLMGFRPNPRKILNSGLLRK
jgi:hypothetical protein